MSAEEKEKYIKKLEDKKERHRIGETILVSVDRLDSWSKADLIGKLFKAYILEDIDLDSYRRICSALERIQLSDLLQLKKIPPLSGKKRGSSPRGISAEVLLTAGFAIQHNIAIEFPKPLGPGVPLILSASVLGIQLFELLGKYAPEYLSESFYKS